MLPSLHSWGTSVAIHSVIFWIIIGLTELWSLKFTKPAHLSHDFNYFDPFILLKINSWEGFFGVFLDQRPLVQVNGPLRVFFWDRPLWRTQRGSAHPPLCVRASFYFFHTGIVTNAMSLGCLVLASSKTSQLMNVPHCSQWLLRPHSSPPTSGLQWGSSAAPWLYHNSS